MLKNAIDSADTVAIAIGDLDDFGKVNNDSGYFYADELILHSVRSIRNCVPDNFILVRTEGDEFAILAPGLSSTELIEYTRPLMIAIYQPIELQHECHEPGLIRSRFLLELPRIRLTV
ncbi:MAG: diguanylate cyclase [Candidatus Obscuribacterales bacterium]|nr:diguanylate cyclase [Candidatus Obscuribacterales bacterium]